MRYTASPALVAAITRLAPTHVAVTNAPSTYEELRADFCLWQRTGLPVHVWNGASDKTIWPTPQANHAFRAFHDLMHFWCCGDLTIRGETETAALTERYLRLHAPELTAEDLRVMWIEVVGQLEYQQINGEFPEDQAAFVHDYLDGSWACDLNRKY